MNKRKPILHPLPCFPVIGSPRPVLVKQLMDYRVAAIKQDRNRQKREDRLWLKPRKVRP